ncbi:MAG: hypothetical protein F083_3188 [bacterium F083]|nr:MAG: hypothetical protein F083_3188 [bacterium F083]
MTNDEVLTSDYFDRFLRRMRKVSDALTDRTKNIKPMFGGTRLLTDQEACAILKVGKRTMQEYRTNGIVPYYLIAGKVLYREQDLEELLQRHYKKPFARR